MLTTVFGSTSHSRAVERTLLPSRRQRRIIKTFSLGNLESGPNSRVVGSVNRLEHCWHLYRCAPLLERPALTVSILQEWQVTVKSPVEFHSQKPDTVGANLCGLGCADYNPGRDWRLGRGLLFHESSILYPLQYVNRKLACNSIGGVVSLRHGKETNTGRHTRVLSEDGSDRRKGGSGREDGEGQPRAQEGNRSEGYRGKVGKTSHNVTDLTANSVLKVDRAKKHIADIRAAIQDLQNSYASTVEQNSKTGVVSLKYDSPRASGIVKEIALIFGDAVHNLRTALDYVWVAAMLHINPAVDIRHLKFPFRNSLQELDAALTGRQINITSPRLFDGMRTDIKPYSGGNDSIWRLHNLDISDKHLLLTPVISYSSISDGRVKDERGRPHELHTFGIRGDGPFYVDMFPGYQVEEHGHISVGVLFDEGAPVPQWEVIAVLEELPLHVTSAMNKIQSWL